MNVKLETIIRTICLAIALINQLLVAAGKSPLPITDEQVKLLVSTGVTIVVAIWTWWQNNSFTKEAIAADEYLERLKEDNRK